MKRAAAFLDRDGILSELVLRDGQRSSPRRLADFKVASGATHAVERLRQCGLSVFVVSNQPDVARGHLPAAELEAMMQHLRARVPVDDVMVCEHDDAEGCDCRKPKPGMLVRLAERWGVDLERSFMVGDSWRDVGAGRSAGCRTLLIGAADVGRPAADLVVGSLEEAVLEIERATSRASVSEGAR